MNPKELNWTTEKPTKSGWYWWKPVEDAIQAFPALVFFNHEHELAAEVILTGSVQTLDEAKYFPGSQDNQRIYNLAGCWARESAKTHKTTNLKTDMEQKNLNWTTEKPSTVGQYWWKADDSDDAIIYKVQVFKDYIDRFDASVLRDEQNRDEVYILNFNGVWHRSGFWAPREKKQNTAPKTEHRNSKLARRIKATEKILKDLSATDTHLLRIMTENQLALMEHILEIDKEGGVVAK